MLFFNFFNLASTLVVVKLGINFKKLLIKEQTGFKELFTGYKPFYTINLLVNKDLLVI